MSCRGFLQCMLKLTNFLLALVGGFIVVYSLWMLKEWHAELPPPQPTPSPSPSLPPVFPPVVPPVPPPYSPPAPPPSISPPAPAPSVSPPAPSPSVSPPAPPPSVSPPAPPPSVSPPAPPPSVSPPAPPPSVSPPAPAPSVSPPAPPPSVSPPASPTPTPTPTPTPPPTPGPAPTPTPAPMPSPTPAPTPSSTPIPTPSPAPSSPPEPEPESEPEPAPVPTPSDAPPVAPGPGQDFVSDFGTENYVGVGSTFQRFDVRSKQSRRPFLSVEKSLIPKFPAPWFIYALLGVGIITLFITCTGHIAAETSHNFCLSCYSCLQVLLLVAQFVLAGYIFFDKHWRKDLPDDPTGQLDKVERFVEDNLNICKWVALGVLILEAFGLFFAMTLRAISADSQRAGYDSDEEFAPRSSTRQPLLNRQSNQASNPTPPGAPAENRPPRNDAWSSRMREKYGLDTTEFTYNPEESRRFAQQNQATPSTEDKPNRCTIM